MQGGDKPNVVKKVFCFCLICITCLSLQVWPQPLFWKPQLSIGWDGFGLCSKLPLRWMQLVQIQCPPYRALGPNRLFSHGLMSTILVSQNNEMVAILVFQTNYVGVQPFQQMLNFSFVPINFHSCWPCE